jgi:hypothetical protein
MFTSSYCVDWRFKGNSGRATGMLLWSCDVIQRLESAAGDCSHWSAAGRSRIFGPPSHLNLNLNIPLHIVSTSSAWAMTRRRLHEVVLGWDASACPTVSIKQCLNSHKLKQSYTKFMVYGVITDSVHLRSLKLRLVLGTDFQTCVVPWGDLCTGSALPPGCCCCRTAVRSVSGTPTHRTRSDFWS